MKIIIDIILFILLLLEFSHGYLSQIIHEIIGLSLIIVLIIHLYLNKEYIKNIFKGKYNTKRIIMLLINILFFISFILSLVFGILSSIEILKFLNIKSLTINKLHKIVSYISLICIGLHIGINFNSMFSKIKINNIVKYILEIIIIVYGIYSFIKLDIIKHIIGTYGFSLIEGSIFINIIRYFSIIMMISIITKYLYSLVKK